MTTITQAGRNEVRNLIGGINSPVAFNYVALGTGSTEESDSDTALATETSATGLARAQITPTAPSDNVLELAKTWTNGSGGTVNIQEYGIFNAASVGDLLLRKVWPSAYPIGDGESITITTQLTLTDETP